MISENPIPLKKHPILWVAFFSLVISTILYGNTLPGAFVYDDFQFVNSPAFHDLNNLFKWLVLPGSPNVPVSGFRPFSYMTMNLQLSLVGDHPWSFHLVNILLNASAIFFVFLLTRRLFHYTRLALLTSVLFAFFPIHTENVASIKGRDDLLAAVLALCAWLLLLHGKRWWSGLVFLLAVLSKELVLFAPILFIFVPGQIAHKPGFWKRITYTIPYLVAGLVYALLRFIAFGQTAFLTSVVTPLFNPLGFADGATKFWTNWKITGMYLTKTFIPYNLSAGYQYNHLPLISSPFWSWEAWVGILSVALLLLFIFRRETRRTPLGIGAIVCAVFFIPVPKILFQGADIFAERWMYMPSVGLAMIGGYFIDRMIHSHHEDRKSRIDDSSRQSNIEGRSSYLSSIFNLQFLSSIFHHLSSIRSFRQIIAWSLFAALLAAYASVIITRNLVWANQRALFMSMIRDAPNNIHGYYSLARDYYGEGELDQAEYLAIAGYRIYSGYPEIIYLLGQIAYHRGDLTAAQEYFAQAAKLVTHSTQIHGMYALMLAKQGKYQEAIDYIGKNRDKMNERYWSILLILGGSYYQLGDIETAKQYLGWDEEKQDFVHRKELDNFLATGTPLNGETTLPDLELEREISNEAMKQ